MNEKYKVCRCKWVVFRDKPSSAGEIIAHAYRGDIVTVSEKCGDWYKIQQLNAYCHRKYLRKMIRIFKWHI